MAFFMPLYKRRIGVDPGPNRVRIVIDEPDRKETEMAFGMKAKAKEVVIDKVVEKGAPLVIITIRDMLGTDTVKASIVTAITGILMAVVSDEYFEHGIGLFLASVYAILKRKTDLRQEKATLAAGEKIQVDLKEANKHTERLQQSNLRTARATEAANEE